MNTRLTVAVNEFTPRNLQTKYIFFMWSQGATQEYAASLLTSLDHPQFQAHICRSVQPVAHNKQQTQETNIHAPGGIRTRNPSNRSAAYVVRAVTGIGNIHV